MPTSARQRIRPFESQVHSPEREQLAVVIGHDASAMAVRLDQICAAAALASLPVGRAVRQATFRSRRGTSSSSTSADASISSSRRRSIPWRTCFRVIRIP